MKFRPCIDIHNGKVKQIVGSSLRDAGNEATENFVAQQDAAFFARLYQRDGVRGGHIILLNSKDSEYYEATKEQALAALRAYPGGLQVGGGITAENASDFLEAGASHVIVTSYVFQDGKICYDNLRKLVETVGKEHIVLDLSCRYLRDTSEIVYGVQSALFALPYPPRGEGYYIVTNRWQVETEERITPELLDKLSRYCDEFLVHAVDVEGKQSGIEEDLVALLGDWGKIPVTYAGGVSNMEDIERIRALGKGKVDFTIGSALDLFGGSVKYENVHGTACSGRRA